MQFVECVIQCRRLLPRDLKVVFLGLQLISVDYVESENRIQEMRCSFRTRLDVFRRSTILPYGVPYGVHRHERKITEHFNKRGEAIGRIQPSPAVESCEQLQRRGLRMLELERRDMRCALEINSWVRTERPCMLTGWPESRPETHRLEEL